MICFVCAELRTRLQLTRPDWSLWFYRDQQNREADFLIQGPYERIRLLDAKWAETARSGAFAALDAVAAVLRNASGIVHVEVGLVGRMAATRRLGASRTAASGFRVADFLPAAGLPTARAAWKYSFSGSTSPRRCSTSRPAAPTAGCRPPARRSRRSAAPTACGRQQPSCSTKYFLTTLRFRRPRGWSAPRSFRSRRLRCHRAAGSGAECAPSRRRAGCQS